MRILIFLFLISLFSSCVFTNQDTAEHRVKLYLLTNLKNHRTYKPIKYHKLDTLSIPDTLVDIGKIVNYAIRHDYTVTNSDNDKIKMSALFLLDKNFRIIDTDCKSINGDYATVSGNIFWRTDDIDVSKSDAGAKITLYSLDTFRQNLKFESIADVSGNFKIDRIPPGEYFFVVNSNNTSQCSDYHIKNLDMYQKQIQQVFGVDLNVCQFGFKEVMTMDSLAFDILKSCTTEYRGSNVPGATHEITLEKHKAFKAKVKAKADAVIKSLPIDIKNKIKLYNPNDKAIEFEIVKLQESKNEYKNIDFGVTCR